MKEKIKDFLIVSFLWAFFVVSAFIALIFIVFLLVFMALPLWLIDELFLEPSKLDAYKDNNNDKTSPVPTNERFTQDD